MAQAAPFDQLPERDSRRSASGAAPKYANADLPPLLEFPDGTRVRNLEGWARRKEEIRRLMCQTFVGTYPSQVPALLEAEGLREDSGEDGSTRREVKLTFDTPNQASLKMCVWIPKGDGPFPVLLTAPRHYQIGWAELALSRGYLVVLHPGVDSHHHEEKYPGYERVWETFRTEYPDATWTEISTKAWLASRCLDYLLDPESGYRIAEAQVGIIGHSRYGKQSLIAAAFDERITSVVARSPGSPGSCPYRFTSRNTTAESPADFPGLWFLPSLREYLGREHELPIDAHGWLGLIAPRRCLIHTAYYDDCDPTFAVERAYLEGRKVYELFGHPERLRVSYRAGTHDPITEQHREENLDWFDLSFGRGTAQMVALYSAALDERLAGVACFCGFTPMRTDTDDKPTGGLRRLWQWHALQPKLGLFHGREHDLPYDFHDVLSLIAPRPCLLYTPRRDRDADFDEVAACVERARKAWVASGHSEALNHLAPDDVNRFQSAQQEVFLEWLEELSRGEQADPAL